MATTDDYGQGVSIATLFDAPNAEALAKNIANAIVQRSVMRFASASARSAALTGPSAPVEGMVAWLKDANLLTVYTGSAWLPVPGGAAVSDQQTASFGTTITTYGTGSSTGSYATCGVSFIAPLSGRVLITTGARVDNTSATAGSLIAPETREGSSIGSGSIVEAALDINGYGSYGTVFMRATATHLLTGLTPGANYNTRLLHRTSQSGTTASFALRELIVAPAP
ncbi:hypothetical protein [Streptomyces echinatus]|uniref:Uncharacterized protein n=1 Tax=Streptomyces echinatus TaxID=67293 RepID=A0A7W9UV20_9ACTN|nr:hypothetical protein [Streptomyces echinatus]MBB5932295.1 hypothetical protein [Streptomyces echinatus]